MPDVEFLLALNTIVNAGTSVAQKKGSTLEDIRNFSLTGNGLMSIRVNAAADHLELYTPPVYVSSVALTPPTGLQVTGSPITSTGTFAVTWATGYQPYLTTESTKLAGIAAGATINSSDASLRDRSTHTGTQSAATITGLATVATAGTFASLTSKPTTLSGYGITDAQPLDTELSAFAGLASAADKLPYFNAVGTMALADFTGAARTLLDDTTVGAMRTTLGLAIGTDVQAFNSLLSLLSALGSLTGKAGQAIVVNGTENGFVFAAAGGTVDVSRRGFFSTNTPTTGTVVTQDAQYIDITVSAVVDYTKTIVNVDGGNSNNQAFSMQQAGSSAVNKLTGRMTSNTNVRIASSATTSGSWFVGVYVVENYS